MKYRTRMKVGMFFAIREMDINRRIPTPHNKLAISMRDSQIETPSAEFVAAIPAFPASPYLLTISIPTVHCAFPADIGMMNPRANAAKNVLWSGC